MTLRLIFCLLLFGCATAALSLDYAPFAVTFPYAGAILMVGEEVTITWTGGDPDWMDITVGLIELTPGYPYAVVQAIRQHSLNNYAAKWSIPAQVQYSGPAYSTVGHTYQFTVYKEDYTFYAYGPRFTVGPSRSSCTCP